MHRYEYYSISGGIVSFIGIFIVAVIIGALIGLIPIFLWTGLFIFLISRIISSCRNNVNNSIAAGVFGIVLLTGIFLTPFFYLMITRYYMKDGHSIIGKPVEIYIDKNQYTKKQLQKYFILTNDNVFALNEIDDKSCYIFSFLIPDYSDTDEIILCDSRIPKYDEHWNPIDRTISRIKIDRKLTRRFYPLRFCLQNDELIQIESNFSILKAYISLEHNEAYKDVPFVKAMSVK